jgi:hypothetical protein
MASRKDHLARERRAGALTTRAKLALLVIAAGVVVFAVSMVMMGGDTFGAGSSRERQAIQLRAWVTLEGRAVPSVAAVAGVAITARGVVVGSSARVRRPADRRRA